MRRRPEPRALGGAIEALADRLAPVSALAEVQRHWAAAVGVAVAREAEPTACADGVVTVTCRSSVWAQELELMGPELVGRLNAAAGCELVARLRCRAAPSRTWARPEE